MNPGCERCGVEKEPKELERTFVLGVGRLVGLCSSCRLSLDLVEKTNEEFCQQREVSWWYQMRPGGQ